MMKLAMTVSLLPTLLLVAAAARGEGEAKPDPGRSFRATIPVTAAGVSPDGKRIVVASAKAAQLWRWGDKKPVWELKIERDAAGRGPLFSPDGKLVAIAESDHRIRVLDAAGVTLWHLKGHVQPVHGLCFSPDGKLLASCGMDAKFLGGEDDNTIRLWDLKTGKQVREFDREHEGTVTSVAFTPDGKQIFSGGEDQTIRVWDVATGKQVKKRDGSWGTWGLTFAPDGKHWGTFGATGSVNAWVHAGASQEASVIFARDVTGQGSGHVAGISFAPDGGSFFAWGKLYETEVTKPAGEEGRPTTRFLAATIVAQRWDFGGRELMTFTHRVAFPKKLESSPDDPRILGITADGRHLLTVTAENDVQGWRLPDPRKERESPARP